MIPVIADEVTLALLDRLPELAEVRTVDGKVVGFFVPASVHRARICVEAAHQVDTLQLVNGQTAHQVGHTMRQTFEYILRRVTDERGTDDLRRSIERMKAEEAAETLDSPPDADPPLQVDTPPG